ncbi:MAG: amidohydrolase [Reyranella sp.]|uniref:amidohydrolase family protein n=1 Tax=Reyranella sp. TaxID=1929291 RepID=UPI001214430C|nr:amidohydrolase [Reyranella sp.]TAJ35470.1 MAG: amidohydrolase [Reyranella sp.]
MAKPPFTIIRGGRLLDIAKRKAAPADILIKGDTIAEIGRPGLAAPAGATVIDARHRLMHPGLINAHTHGPGNLGKGLGDLWSLELLLTASPWIGGGRTLEDKHLSAMIGAAEMVMKGCTAAYDLAAEFPLPSVDGLSAMAKAYEEVGMRAVLAPMVADLSFFEAIPGLMERLSPSLQKEVESFRLAPWKATARQIRKALQKWPFEKVALAVAPTIPHHCTDDFLIACRDLAREYDVGIHSHVAESKVQVVAGYKRYGSTLAAHMDELGLVNERFTVAHGVWLDDDDMKRLGDRGASVAHNPGSNMRLGSGLADVRGMLNRKVNVGVGTDGANCADNQNMYEAMRLASLASKVQGPDWQKWLTTKEALLAATEGSARALGMEKQIGRIAPGYKADIVFLDLHHINWIPMNDPVNALVHTEDGTGVHSVMIGGRMVVENRRLLTVDLAALAAKAEASRMRREKITAPAKKLYDRLEKVVGTFCPGLAKAPLHIHRYGASHHHAH